MKTINVLKDLSTLTTIPEDIILKLVEKMEYCISDAIVEAIQAGESTVDLDIGIGTLSLKIDEEEVMHKFVPSSNFDGIIKSSVLDEQNLLSTKLEHAFVEKVLNVYKDLI